MSKEILDRFMHDIKAGAPVWYQVNDELDSNFCIYEPTDEKPWQWVGNRVVADRLLLHAPQAVQIWVIPDSEALREMLREMGIKP